MHTKDSITMFIYTNDLRHKRVRGNNTLTGGGTSVPLLTDFEVGSTLKQIISTKHILIN